jgi:DNA-directed RNA polymerase subunit alpha
MTREVTLRVGYGRGYLPSERIEGMFDKVNDEILIDALYSPVRLVNYYVEDKRVGGQTDMDRVILDIHTDGRISPKEALSFAAQIINIHFSIFDELNFQTISFDSDEEETPSDRDSILHKLALKISEIELSVRSTNCLQIANIDTIAELVIMQELDMLKFRNFGKKSLNEIKAKLDEMGLSLGMDLAKYGINKDNVKDIVADLAHSEKTQ